ncbi:MAG: hypothetical protein JKY22_02200, partial [Flavobacteriaceae bacterium]|nr:hypothetical protein [Flavobacteriaceae bacterium]
LEIAGPKNNEYVRLNLTLRAIISKKAKYTAEVIKKDGLEISDKMGLLVERSLVPISGNIASNPIYKGIFDEEFYTRNGAIYTEKVIKRLNDPDIAKMTNIKIKKIDENLFEPTGPGVTCYNAHFQIAVS